MNFTIATLTAVILSLTTVDVNAVKLNTTMKQKEAIAKHVIPDDVALLMVDMEQPDIDEEDIGTVLVALEQGMAEVATPVLATWDTLSCNAGEYELAGACQVCPPGTMSYNDAQECITCPDNYYSAANSA